MPFNWRSHCGYWIALLLEVVTALPLSFTISTIMAFLIGSCWLSISFVVDLTHELTHFDSFVSEVSTKSDETKLKEELWKIIQLNSKTKQLSG